MALREGKEHTMRQLLALRITSERLDRYLSWAAGFGILVVCTTVVLKALPELGLATSCLVIGSLGLGWMVLGHLAPKGGQT
jgi:hypothetical protein